MSFFLSLITKKIHASAVFALLIRFIYVAFESYMMNRLANKCRTAWLLWQNKILSSIIIAIGYAPHTDKDKDEVDIIVPMYGMPSSVYKKKEATATQAQASKMPCLHILPEKESRYAV